MEGVPGRPAARAVLLEILAELAEQQAVVLLVTVRVVVEVLALEAQAVLLEQLVVVVVPAARAALVAAEVVVITLPEQPGRLVLPGQAARAVLGLALTLVQLLVAQVQLGRLERAFQEQLQVKLSWAPVVVAVPVVPVVPAAALVLVVIVVVQPVARAGMVVVAQLAAE